MEQAKLIWRLRELSEGTVWGVLFRKFIRWLLVEFGSVVRGELSGSQAPDAPPGLPPAPCSVPPASLSFLISPVSPPLIQRYQGSRLGADRPRYMNEGELAPPQVPLGDRTARPESDRRDLLAFHPVRKTGGRSWFPLTGFYRQQPSLSPLTLLKPSTPLPRQPVVFPLPAPVAPHPTTRCSITLTFSSSLWGDPDIPSKDSFGNSSLP